MQAASTGITRATRPMMQKKLAARPGARPSMRRAITGFRQDEEGHWIADLDCGHSQHVRHDPPWMIRPWVTTAEGRAGFVGRDLECRECIEAGAG